MSCECIVGLYTDEELGIMPGSASSSLSPSCLVKNRNWADCSFSTENVFLHVGSDKEERQKNYPFPGKVPQTLGNPPNPISKVIRPDQGVSEISICESTSELSDRQQAVGRERNDGSAWIQSTSDLVEDTKNSIQYLAGTPFRIKLDV